MKHRERKRGFLLVWAAVSMTLVLLLGGGLLFLTGTAARYVRRSSDRAEAVLIGQEMMETMKSNARFHTELPIPSEVVRNGKTFHIDAEKSTQIMNGIPMRQVAVTVSGGEEQIQFQSLVGRSGI